MKRGPEIRSWPPQGRGNRIEMCVTPEEIENQNRPLQKMNMSCNYSSMFKQNNTLTKITA